jgi:hypothetical protein
LALGGTASANVHSRGAQRHRVICPFTCRCGWSFRYKLHATAYPPAASRVAGTENNDSSNSAGSGSGSSRPIFSPTQTSAKGDHGVPSVMEMGTTHVPKVLRTYGTLRSASPQKQESHPHSRRRFVLSSSPPVEDPKPSHEPGRSHDDGLMSESEVQEEIETPKPNRTRGSTLEVVLSARPTRLAPQGITP